MSEGKRWNVKLLPVAAADFEETAHYIRVKLANISAAKALVDELYHALEQLKTHPMIGPMVEDELLAAGGYRKLVVKNFLALYKLDSERKQVIVMRIIYGGRDYRNIL